MGAALCSPSSVLPPRPCSATAADSGWRLETGVVPPAPRAPTRNATPVTEASFLDAYELGGLLGIGAFGQVRVCWAKNEMARRRQAVKVVDMMGEVFRHASAFISARQEVSVLRCLRHPHIVELVEVFEQDQFLFMVMELVGGGELFASLANPRLAVTEGCVAAVGQQLLQALRHIHERGIVHRDVKAENILLASNPGTSFVWHVKLIDFGLAMREDPPPSYFQLCQTPEEPLEGLVCGTAYYCAPEVWVNDYGPKVDVWAAGVVLYLALHGNFPFYDRDVTVMEAMICSPRKLPTFKPACAAECPGYQASPRATRLLSELLEKDPDERPSAAAALGGPWFSDFRRSRSLLVQPRVEPMEDGSFAARSVSAGAIGSSSSCSWAEAASDGDQIIPAPVRAKAGRAVSRQGELPREELHAAAMEALRACAACEKGRRRPEAKSFTSRAV